MMTFAMPLETVALQDT